MRSCFGEFTCAELAKKLAEITFPAGLVANALIEPARFWQF
jgi:hypothetical protein